MWDPRCECDVNNPACHNLTFYGREQFSTLVLYNNKFKFLADCFPWHKKAALYDLPINAILIYSSTFILLELKSTIVLLILSLYSGCFVAFESFHRIDVHQ